VKLAAEHLGAMPEVAQTVSGSDSGDIEAAAIVHDAKTKAPRLPRDFDLHLCGVRMFGDVVHGFAEEKKYLAMKRE
jgi:hypothetical protein